MPAHTAKGVATLFPADRQVRPKSYDGFIERLSNLSTAVKGIDVSASGLARIRLAKDSLGLACRNSEILFCR